MADEMTVKAIGKLLSDRNFSEDFSRNPEKTLEDNGLAVPDDVLPKLIELNTKLKDMGFTQGTMSGGQMQDTHCNVASNVGLA